ncbi:MAG: TRAP transporter substrate-binding protein [Vicinamibacterales bacterium]|jgi:tripartite ATP-independent transporter DctP family solute receptor|nr:TRAP transporter substrate-binding protein DctP [Acidobacteriota bacterium]MDP6373516.1 TRAP transporter substrate-binding protein [Vicinamibacterales bacterium]MDP6608720.1 TRAP transporter substrate-binding protein [Vicinamibacterales bacterium]HAK55995.1 TRAP transporter substrate-binding protein DctP [Acidobacteriota bacterium]|tara:strand:+ start:4560 stop:5543 length:984 start_codon:yes stop_codon:yes gene_type:complete
MPRALAVIRTGLVLVSLSAAACAPADDVTVLKLGHGLDVEHPVHLAMEVMAETAGRLSDGGLRIDIYPGEQLGSERELLELVQLGILAMTKSSSAPMESFVPTMKVFGLPYLFRGTDHLWQVLQGPVGEEILASGTRYGLKGLGYYDAGARSFYTRDRPIREPADLRGLKIRVQKSVMAMQMVEALGGSPTPIDWGELYSALDQGVVDGAENNRPSFFVSRHHEIARYYSLDEHSRQPDVLVINPDVWAALSTAHQAALTRAVNESVTFQRHLWRQAAADSLADAERDGVEVIRPDLRLFREAVQPVWRAYDNTDIGALARRIQEVE